MGSCQNYGPFFGGSLNNRCRIKIRDPKGDHNFDNHPCGVCGSWLFCGSGHRAPKPEIAPSS